jgi:putative Mn2+ efflux pump MntP
MEIITLLIIAIGLSFDSFAVSISCALIQKEIKFFKAFRIAFLFALLQGLMPVAGWFIGHEIKAYIENIDHWIAFILLSFIGFKMIIDSKKERCNENNDTLKFTVVLMMAFATSIDAFIVGIGFGIIEVNILLAVIIIGFITFIVSMLGMLFGKKTGKKFGSNIEVVGGVILILIGLKITIEHLFFY